MNPLEPLVTTDPLRMGGTPVFAGTRVPVKTLFDHLVDANGLEVFLDDFPTVTGNKPSPSSKLPVKPWWPMRVLLDECVPKAFRRQLHGHFVVTIREMGWSGKQNGELLALMQIAGFEVLVTVDQNLRYQQNLAASSISLLVMIAKTNKLQDLIPLAEPVRLALAVIVPGTVVEVSRVRHITPAADPRRSPPS